MKKAGKSPPFLWTVAIDRCDDAYDATGPTGDWNG